MLPVLYMLSRNVQTIHDKKKNRKNRKKKEREEGKTCSTKNNFRVVLI